MGDSGLPKLKQGGKKYIYEKRERKGRRNGIADGDGRESGRKIATI